MSPYLHSLLAAALLAALHLAASRLRFLHVVPRSRWLSFAGGISVAYVFMHLLPELAASQAAVEGRVGGWVGALEHHVYLVALAGLVLFYGLEHAARRDRRAKATGAGADGTGPMVFAVSVSTFATYNALIGYLLVEQIRHGASNLYLFTAAMGLHFLVNDDALVRHHRERYLRTGRWLLSAAVLLGALVEPVMPAARLAAAALIAFLSGGVILNVLKEELPEERDSRPAPFLLGAAGFSALLLALPA